MVKFEYATVKLKCLYDHTPKDNLPVLKQVFVIVTKYVSPDQPDVKETEIVDVLEPFEDYYVGHTTTWKWQNNRLKCSLLDVIAPTLSSLGNEGWEAVEYKVNENDFCEALLKRKVQKK